MPWHLVSLVFHNSHWWSLWALSSPPPWCNCSTLTFPIATSRDCTSYWGYHATMSSHPCLSQQLLVRFMSLLIATTLTQSFDSDFPHSHRQGLHKLLRLPCHDIRSASSFTTATGEVYESPHRHHPDTIVRLWLSPLPSAGIAQVIKTTMLQCPVSLAFHNSCWWCLWAFPSLQLWGNCLSSSFAISASRVVTCYREYHCMISDQACLL